MADGFVWQDGGARLCMVADCGRPVLAKGYCRAHYGRLKTGQLMCEPVKGRIDRKAPCLVETCTKLADGARGYCQAHYARMKNGMPLDALMRASPEPRQKLPCRFDGCDKPSSSKGYCTLHYGRQRLGMPLDAPKKPVITVDNLRETARERNGLCLSTAYINSTTHYLWQCAKGHTWRAVWNSIQRGTWCPLCPSGRGERTSRKILETMFQCDLPKCKPDWLRIGDSLQALELDGYNERLKIAFEYQGGQHYEVSKRDHRFAEDDVKIIQNNDAAKRQRCWDRGVALIVIPEVVNHKNIPAFLAQIEFAVLNAGLKIPKDWPKRRDSIDDVVVWGVDQRPITEEMREHATKLGGACLSETYVTVDDRLTWTCAEGHVWTQTWSKVKMGHWCKSCRGKEGHAKRVVRFGPNWADSMIAAKTKLGHLRGTSQGPNGRWRAQGKVNGKVRYLGSFATAEEAHEAWKKAVGLT